MASQGTIRLGDGQIEDKFWQSQAPRVSEKALSDALLTEREDD
jgi:hypothetical protein